MLDLSLDDDLSTVDERLDPYKSTLAAAQFLNINYAILGSWPLALTAYNHGAGGMRHAREKMGTDDIVTIVRNYQSRTFGFASRNYYAEFLAAVDAMKRADDLCGPLQEQAYAPEQVTLAASASPEVSRNREKTSSSRMIRSKLFAISDGNGTMKR